MTKLAAQIRPVESLGAAAMAQMWGLFAAHYDCVEEAQFRADLAEKDAVILLTDPAGAVQGFSTYQVLEGTPRSLFSGDTIIHCAWWGRHDFAGAWLRNAGRIAAAGTGPLYWLLIVKGHRTYRYLPVFAKEYAPRADGAAGELLALRDRLAQAKFGACYDAASGVVRFPLSRGQLRPELAAVPEKDRDRPEVAFFIAANPGYAAGDELVCVCRLAPDNLTPIARRAFEAGLHDAKAAGC
jgi:hypothetical protein